MSTINTVDTKCLARLAMENSGIGWQILDALYSGTKAMRNMETVFPQSEKESEESYKERKANAWLFGAYKKTLTRLAGKPFIKPVTINGKLPDQIQGMVNNIDGKGQSLTTSCRSTFVKAMHKGVCYLLTDYPATMDESGNTPNLKDERELGLMPQIKIIPVENMFSWTWGADGKLDEIRFYVKTVEKDGAWGEKNIEQVWVYRRSDYELWQRDSVSAGNYEMIRSGTHTLGEVPLTPVNLNPDEDTDGMTAEPCLNELAEVNCTHFQSSADQRIGLHYGRFLTMYMTGVPQDTIDTPTVIGVNRIHKFTNPDAKIQYAEYSGKTFEVGERDLDRLEKQIEWLGMQPLMQRSGNQTATGQAIDQANNESDMQSWVRTVETAYEEAFRKAARIVKVELPEDFSVDIFNEFTLSGRAVEDLKILQTDRMNGNITKETYLNELKRRGVLPEGLDVETEISKADLEADNLGMFGRNDGE